MQESSAFNINLPAGVSAVVGGQAAGACVH